MVIENRQQLVRNINTVESYLNDTATEDQYTTMSNYIKRGHVFIAYVVDGHYHFAPSRFLGYKDNSLEKHENNEEKDGRITTPAISKILHSRNITSSQLDEEFKKYCIWLGEEAPNIKRSYWMLEGDVLPDLETQPFYEGAYKLRTHLRRERNQKVVTYAKELFKSKHNGMLFCEACGINFKEGFGIESNSMIEAHHKIEFSKGKGVQRIDPTDFVMLCPTCHKMIHCCDISFDELKRMVR